MDLAARMRAVPTPLLWDGGIGTALIERGLDLSVEPPEAWLLGRPAEVAAVHQGFAAAGCDVLQTNTFGLLRLLLKDGGPPPWLDARAACRAAVSLCRAAAGRAAVVASLGPSGLLSPDPERVEATCAELAAFFYQEGQGGQAGQPGVAALHLETFYDPREAQAALRGVRRGAPGLPVLMSITVNAGNSGLETPMGIPIASMLRAMEREMPDAVGANCSQHARRMLSTVEILRSWTGGRLPILAQPQVDQAQPDCKRRTPPETEEQFVHGLLALLEAGADAIGGCCGCGPGHLAAMRRALDSLDEPRQSRKEGG